MLFFNLLPRIQHALERQTLQEMELALPLKNVQIKAVLTQELVQKDMEFVV